MASIKSLALVYCTYIVTLIFSVGKIMPIYSYYTKKKLVCITITVLFSCQPFSYLECTKLNFFFL